MESEEKSKGFQVRDKRRFTETGEARDQNEAEEARAETPPEAPSAAPARPARGGEDYEPTPITLSTFLVSLSTQALVLLGEMPNPATGELEPDLGGVQEIIDLIAMLKEKTRGNVDAQETQLFEKILYDLRMLYVEKVRG